MKKIILLFTSVLFFSNCGKKENNKEVKKNIRPVNYIIVSKSNPLKNEVFSGMIHPEVLSKLSFRVNGTLINKNVDLGDKVKKGEILAKIDPTDYLIQYREAVAEVRNFSALSKNSYSIFTRNKILYLENSVSRALYEQSLANYNASIAQLQVSKQKEAYAKKQLNYTSLISPANGTISEVNIELNENITSGTPVFTLNESEDLNILFNVSDNIINQLKLGDKINFNLVVSNKTLKGKIINIGTVSNGYGNTFPIKAKILSQQNNLRVGMVGTVHLILSNNNTSISVPINSILSEKNDTNKVRTYVYVINNIKNNIGTVQKKEVEIGNATSNGITIKKGLSEGEYVVTTGATILLNGDLVKLGIKGGK